MNETEFCHQSAVEQKRLPDGGTVSVLELVDAHIKRIGHVDPVLNAFVTLHLDEARDEAKAADRVRSRNDARGVLHGLPIGVKDCFRAKGLRTKMACPALRDHVPEFDHLVVEREKPATCRPGAG